MGADSLTITPHLRPPKPESYHYDKIPVYYFAEMISAPHLKVLSSSANSIAQSKAPSIATSIDGAGVCYLPESISFPVLFKDLLSH
jgi:hypothetical protein